MGPRQVWHIVWTVLWAIHNPRGNCRETMNIVCNFQGDMCGFVQDNTEDFDWSIAREEASISADHKSNNYICACRNTTSLSPGSLARLVSPIYKVATPSLLSLRFRHFKTEGDGSLLRISVESTTRAMGEQPFFRPLDDSKSELPWSMLEGKIDVFAPFRLVIEAEVGYFTRSRVAIDDIILTLYSYPMQYGITGNDSASTNSSGSQLYGQSDALMARSGVTSHNESGKPNHSNEVLQEMTKDSDDEGVSLCFVLALTSTSLLVIVLLILMFVVLSLRKKRRYRRFNFGHDYEEIKSKEAYNQTTSVSAIALMKEHPQPRLVYHNRYTSSSRIHSLSSCLSRLSMRDSLRSSIYAEITEADLDFDGDLSDPGIGISTTMTTICTGTWDIGSSSTEGSEDRTVEGGSCATSSMNKMYPNLSDAASSQNDSGWVENIIYERTSDVSSFDSDGGPFGITRALKAIGRNKITAGFKARQRVHTV